MRRIYLLLIISLFVIPCRSIDANGLSVDLNSVSSISIAAPTTTNQADAIAYVGEATVGSVSPNVTGLSFPKATILRAYCPLCAAGSSPAAKRMIALMTTAGIRHLRILVNEVGTVITYVPNSPQMNQVNNQIGDSDLQNFAHFVCSVPNLTFSWGINYLGNSPANAAAEAVAIDRLLGSNGTACRGRLTGFEIGNEPDSPGYGTVRAESSATAFAKGWRQFASAIVAAVPGVNLVGPSLGGESDFASYMPSFIAANSDLLGVLTQHYYQIGSPSQATIASIVPKVTDSWLLQAAPDLESVSAANRRIPIEINEGNTVANGGAVGVSNTFASAIYAVTNVLDFSTYAYGAGPVTIDFTSEGTPFYGPTYTGGYSPIVDGPGYTGPNPMLTGIKLVNMLGPGDLRQCTLSAGDANLRCFVVVSGTTTNVVLVNQETSLNETVITVFPEAIHAASSILMTAPSLTATTGATIQGASIQSDGSLTLNAATPQTIVATTQVSITVPAHSVLILTAN